MDQRELIIFSLDPATQSIDNEWFSFSVHQSYVTQAAMDTVRLQLNLISSSLSKASKDIASSASVPNKLASLEQAAPTVSSLPLYKKY
jgi:hypothetical protein